MCKGDRCVRHAPFCFRFADDFDDDESCMRSTAVSSDTPGGLEGVARSFEVSVAGRAAVGRWLDAGAASGAAAPSA